MTAARPDERTLTSNEAALRFQLRADGIATLADRAALDRFAAARPDTFARAMRAFAGVPDGAADLPLLVRMLLDADLRPDDRLLVAGLPPWPWLGMLGATLVSDPAQADVVAAPAAWLAAAALAGGPRVVAVDDPA
jgi:hypothetical protein